MYVEIRLDTDSMVRVMTKLREELDARAELGLIGFAKYVDELTFPYVPFLTGLLEGSIYGFHEGSPDGRGSGYKVNKRLKNGLVSVDLWYSAKDPISGYDYAEIQHEVVFDHDNRLGARRGRGVKHPTDHYLYEGLSDAAPMMAEKIATKMRVVF